MEKVDTKVTSSELAATYLNLCAIYVELGYFAEASNKALKSVLLIQSYLKKLKPTIALYDMPLDQDEDIDMIIKHGQSNKSFKFLDAQVCEKKLEKATIQTIEGDDEESDLLNLSIFRNFKPDQNPLGDSVMSSKIGETKRVDLSTVMGTYSAAYYNLGASFENLKKHALAKQAYQRSKTICETYLPNNLAVIH